MGFNTRLLVAGSSVLGGGGGIGLHMFQSLREWEIPVLLTVKLIYLIVLFQSHQLSWSAPGKFHNKSENEILKAESIAHTFAALAPR